MSLKSRRSWLTLGYVVATVLAQGAHHHGPGAGESQARARACIIGTHWESSDAGAAGTHSTCAVCKFRSEHHAGQARTVVAREAATAFAADRPDPVALSSRTLRLSCRAPPLA